MPARLHLGQALTRQSLQHGFLLIQPFCASVSPHTTSWAQGSCQLGTRQPPKPVFGDMGDPLPTHHWNLQSQAWAAFPSLWHCHSPPVSLSPPLSPYTALLGGRISLPIDPTPTPSPLSAPSPHEPQQGMSSSVEEVWVSSGDGFFLEKLMILVIFFPAARLIEPFRSARPLFLPFPGRTGQLCDPSACPGILPGRRRCCPAVGTQLALAGWAVGTGTVPCSPCSLRVAGDPVSPMATLSESEVCFSWDSRCGRAESHQHHPPATASPSSPCTGLGYPVPVPLPSPAELL